MVPVSKKASCYHYYHDRKNANVTDLNTKHGSKNQIQRVHRADINDIQYGIPCACKIKRLSRCFQL